MIFSRGNLWKKSSWICLHQVSSFYKTNKQMHEFWRTDHSTCYQLILHAPCVCTIHGPHLDSLSHQQHMLLTRLKGLNESMDSLSQVHGKSQLGVCTGRCDQIRFGRRTQNNCVTFWRLLDWIAVSFLLSHGWCQEQGYHRSSTLHINNK